MDRKELALSKINLKKSGIEIGPLYDPVVKKVQGNISYVDHMSTEDLKKKYKGHPIPLDLIVKVDYILKNNSLKETLGRKKFDYVIASHVIEHIPNTIYWLKDVSSILNDGGVLSLIIPDKRFTFDIARKESTLAEVVGAYIDNIYKVNSTMLFDHIYGVRDGIDAKEIWNNPNTDIKNKPKNTIEKAYLSSLKNKKPDFYMDAHCFTYTPRSFFEILKGLIELDLIDYEVIFFHDTLMSSNEFFVSLKKSKASKKQKLKAIPKFPESPTEHALISIVEKLENELGLIKSSTSWRVTKPLRSMKNVLIKIRHF